MLVSFIIPTRQRVTKLIEAINSIKNKASSDVKLEFFVRIDNDDYETLAVRDRIPAEILIGPRWCGFNSIATYLNELAKKTNGDWIIPWSDDMFMQTQDWDKLLPPADHAEIRWCSLPGSWLWALPFMSKKLYNLWGCFTGGNPTDAWLVNIWKAAGKKLPTEEEMSIGHIVVNHPRNEINIAEIGIKPKDCTPAPIDSNMKSPEELVRLLRESI